MRKEFEPNMGVAEKLYPKIKKLIEEYTGYCDENGDEEFMEYKKPEAKLHEITGKDISKYNLWEYWEEEGLEVLSFRISLPEPNIISNITKEELTEIINVLKKCDFNHIGGNGFVNDFRCCLDRYYHQLLKVNFRALYL